MIIMTWKFWYLFKGECYLFFSINLLCYERFYKFCHGHVVTVWLEKKLGVKVVECEFVDDKIVEK